MHKTTQTLGMRLSYNNIRTWYKVQESWFYRTFKVWGKPTNGYSVRIGFNSTLNWLRSELAALRLSLHLPHSTEQHKMYIQKDWSGTNRWLTWLICCKTCFWPATFGLSWANTPWSLDVCHATAPLIKLYYVLQIKSGPRWTGLKQFNLIYNVFKPYKTKLNIQIHTAILLTKFSLFHSYIVSTGHRTKNNSFCCCRIFF